MDMEKIGYLGSHHFEEITEARLDYVSDKLDMEKTAGLDKEAWLGAIKKGLGKVKSGVETGLGKVKKTFNQRRQINKLKAENQLLSAQHAGQQHRANMATNLAKSRRAEGAANRNKMLGIGAATGATGLVGGYLAGRN